MAKLKEILERLETEKAELLERMETLQNRLDQSPGQQQVSQLQTEMAELRQKLETAESRATETAAKLEALTQTPPPPSNVVDTPEVVPAPIARPDEPARQSNPRQRKGWC